MPRPQATSRASIDAVALDLFLDQGFDAVTSQALAEACGISRPTLFRYVSRMADLVLDHVDHFGDLTVELVRRSQMSAWPAIAEAFTSCYADLEANQHMGKAFLLLSREPGLRAQSGLMVRRWRSNLADALREHGVDDPMDREAVAGAAVGVVTAAFAGGWTAEQLARALEVCTPAGLPG